MLLTLAAILIDRLLLRRTPEQRLVAAVAKANRIAAERAALERQIAANQTAIVNLTATQGPELITALSAMLSGSIGGKVGLGFQPPNRPGHGY